MENENDVVDTVDTVSYDDDNTASDTAPAVENSAEDTAPAETIEESAAATAEPAPVEVISVDDLLSRLGSPGSEENEQTGETSGDTSDTDTDEGGGAGPIEGQHIDDMGTYEILTVVKDIRESVAQHPAMTTDFADYTVGEALLLLLVLSVFTSWLIRLLKGGFSWLLW